MASELMSSTIAVDEDTTFSKKNTTTGVLGDVYVDYVPFDLGDEEENPWTIGSLFHQPAFQDKSIAIFNAIALPKSVGTS
jgi:hypothetical protein